MGTGGGGSLTPMGPPRWILGGLAHIHGPPEVDTGEGSLTPMGPPRWILGGSLTPMGLLW